MDTISNVIVYGMQLGARLIKFNANLTHIKNEVPFGGSI